MTLVHRSTNLSVYCFDVLVGQIMTSRLSLSKHLAHSLVNLLFFFFSSRRRHTRLTCDWSSDVCSSDLRTPVSCSTPSPFVRGAAPSSTSERVARFVTPNATVSAWRWSVRVHFGRCSRKTEPGFAVATGDAAADRGVGGVAVAAVDRRLEEWSPLPLASTTPLIATAPTTRTVSDVFRTRHRSGPPLSWSGAGSVPPGNVIGPPPPSVTPARH